MSKDTNAPSPDRRRFLQQAGLAAGGRLLPTGPAAPRGSLDDHLSQPRTPDALPSVAVIALNRMGFGPRPGDIADFVALGGDADARLNAYIDQQLDPDTIDDGEHEARLATAGFITLDKSLTQLWADHVVNAADYDERIRPMRETERLAFIRAVYSKKQLVEVLADFWHNHFNVRGWDYYIAPTFVHYDRDVIRDHMLGNFRAMLEAVATSPAMLYYLDNFTNTREGPNENWARELFELHTVGAENYLGVKRQNEVPVDEQGRPVGYVDDDVYEATRCFTGWTLSNRPSDPAFGNTGEFFYYDQWHDRFQKNILGLYIPPDQEAMKDGRDVLDLLADHPGTARHISRKLCRRLIGDTPPESVVQSAADLFHAQRDAPDQLKQVVAHILRSDAFRTTWGDKVKRPFEAIVSALRATGADFTIRYEDGDSDSFLYYYGLIGQPLFNWPAPNGYPDHKEDWLSSTSLVMRWRMLNWLVDVTDDGDNFRLDIIGQTPPATRSPNGLVDFWVNRLLARSLAPAERAELVDFMAQGRNPELPLDFDDTAVLDRLRSLAALIFLSPEFQLR